MRLRRSEELKVEKVINVYEKQISSLSKTIEDHEAENRRLSKLNQQHISKLLL